MKTAMKTAIAERACTITIRGYSDDTFICEGDGIDLDDDDCARGCVREIILCQTDGSGLVVRGVFGAGAGWLVGAAPLDEGMHFYPTAVLTQNKHSMVLTVAVGAGTVITMTRLTAAPPR